MTNLLKHKPYLIITIIVLVVLIVLVVFNFVSVVFANRLADNKKSTNITTTTEQASVFKEFAKPIYLSPKTITFKNKTLQIEEVGVEGGGELGVPASWQTAGWYKDGAKPGEEGNVIVDGHYDTNTGAPGAFWGLKDLQIGDRVLLTDLLGRVFEYKVVDKSYISITDPERANVFASSTKKELTLITCGGVWDYPSGTYNKRLVIKAEFDKMEKAW